jgi:hypothetical protein
MGQVIEIEVDTPNNGDLFFLPAMQRVRGRFLPTRVASEDIGRLVRDFPNGVPGQRIRLDTAAAMGSIIEPLHDEEHAATAAAVEKRLLANAPGNGEVGYDPPVKEHMAFVPTWLLWMRRAVNAGYARLVKGKLPDADPPEGTKELFRPAASRDEVIEKLTAMLFASMPAEKQKEVMAILAK